MGILENMVEESGKRVFILPEDQRIEVDLADIEMIFKGFRPRLMSIEDFKNVRKIINKEVAHYLKGQIIHVSKVNDAVWSEYTKDMKHKVRQKGHIYIRKNESNEGSKT